MTLRAALLWPVLAGCSTAMDIEGRDHEAFLPAARVFVPVQELSTFEATRDLSGVEGSVAIVQDHVQSPGIGRLDYDLVEVSLAYRGGIEKERFEGFLLFGLDFTHFQLTTPFERRDEDGLGLMTGLQAGFKVLPWLVPYGRATIAGLDFSKSSGQAEAGLILRFTEHADLQLGYRYWRYRSEDVASTVFGVPAERDVDIAVDGYHVGMEVRF